MTSKYHLLQFLFSSIYTSISFTHFLWFHIILLSIYFYFIIFFYKRNHIYMSMYTWSSEINIVSMNLPPGFRFFPTDEELVVHFLHRKASLLPCHPDVIPDLDLYPYDPWDLPGIYTHIYISLYICASYMQHVHDDPIVHKTCMYSQLCIVYMHSMHVGLYAYYAYYALCIVCMWVCIM